MITMKKNIIYLSILLVGLLATGCKKQLDLQPTDTFSDANAFKTMADVQEGTNGAFGRYSTFVNIMYTNAILTDEAKLGQGNSGQGAITYRYQFSSDGTTGGDVVAAFGGFYALIDQVNRVLPNVATVTATPAEEPRRNILKGQLLGLRALGHFHLLEAYAKKYDATDPLGIPVMTVSNPLAKPARNTVAEVLGAVEADLAEAKNLLPAVTVANFSDTVLNRVSIAAYQARVALFKRDYASAITFATEVINSAVKPISSGAAFSGIWTDVTNNETLFRIRFATGTGVGAIWTTTGNQVYIAPSDKLIASYGAGDIRSATYIGSLGPGNNYVNKFYQSSRGGRVVDLKACRIAEMYLIRAEAHARKSSPDITAGAADLNLLRTNRISPYTNEVFANQADLITAVMNERFKELCFEGFRFYDLKRNDLPVQRLSSDAQPEWQTLAAGDFRFALPIPRDELNANPNMVQNQGY